MPADLARGARVAAPWGCSRGFFGLDGSGMGLGETVLAPFRGRAVRCPAGARERGSFRSVRGSGAICVAQNVTILMFPATISPSDTRIVRKLPRSRPKARASPLFEERVASRDQTRPFSHHMQPQALETPPETPQERWHRPARARTAGIQALERLRIRQAVRPPPPRARIAGILRASRRIQPPRLGKNPKTGSRGEHSSPPCASPLLAHACLVSLRYPRALLGTSDLPDMKSAR